MAKAKIDKNKAVVHYKKSDGVYVVIPEYDKLGNPHQGAAINEYRYEAGKTYYMEPVFAEELERILEIYDEQTLALLMGRINKRALAQLGARDFVFKAEE